MFMTALPHAHNPFMCHRSNRRQGKFLSQVYIGGAQVPPGQLAVEPGQLFGQGVIEAQGIELYLDLNVGELIIVFKIALFRHKAQEGEEDGDDDEQCEKSPQDPLADIFPHESFPFLWCDGTRSRYPHGLSQGPKGTGSEKPV